MKISVVIPSFRRHDLILSLLNDLTHQEGPTPEIIIADDCSGDDSVAVFRKFYPSVIVIENEKNSGPAVTRNNAIRRATGDIIVGFDSDVSAPDRQLLQKVRKAFRDYPQVGAFAFRLFNPDGVTDDAKRWWHPHPIQTHALRIFETSYFSGTGYAMRREVMTRAGLFPEYLYMHYEECILAYQIIRVGSSLVYHPELTVVHHARPEKRRSVIRSFYKPRNQIAFAVSSFPFLAALAYTIPRIGYSLWVAMTEGTIRDYIRAMVSAAQNYQIYRNHRCAMNGAQWSYLQTINRETVVPISK